MGWIRDKLEEYRWRKRVSRLAKREVMIDSEQSFKDDVKLRFKERQMDKLFGKKKRNSNGAESQNSVSTPSKFDKFMNVMDKLSKGFSSPGSGTTTMQDKVLRGFGAIPQKQNEQQVIYVEPVYVHQKRKVQKRVRIISSDAAVKADSRTHFLTDEKVKELMK